MQPTISEKCINCGSCVKLCPNKVFADLKRSVKVEYPEKCTGCKICENQCCVKAIKVN